MIVAIPAALASVVAIQFIGPRDSYSPTPNPATGQVIPSRDGNTGITSYVTEYQTIRGTISVGIFLIVPIVIIFAFRSRNPDANRPK